MALFFILAIAARRSGPLFGKRKRRRAGAYGRAFGATLPGPLPASRASSLMWVGERMALRAGAGRARGAAARGRGARSPAPRSRSFRRRVLAGPLALLAEGGAA